MRHSSTLWAAVGALSLVAAEAELGAIPFEDVPQLDERGFDKRQCCCQNTATVTETVTNCYVPIPEPETSTIYIEVPTTVEVEVPTTVYTTVEEIVTEWETQIETQIRTTSYPVTIGVPVNCVPAGEDDDTPAYPTGAEPEECSTITTTEWRTTTTLEFVTSYRPTTVPTTIEVEVPTTIRNTVTNTVTDYDTVTDERTVTNEVTDRITSTLPGVTVTRVITTTVAADTVTVTEDGTTSTRTVPGSTVVVTTTEVLPGETVIITPIYDVTLCPRPTGNGEPIDYSSDETWGCKPGYVCIPPKPDGCNFWPELPTEDFRCKPEHCQVAPPYANTTWEDGESSYYPPSYGYYHLNPEAFGLSYGIFEFDVYVEKDKYTTRTITTGDWESQATLTDWPQTTSTSTSSEYYYDSYHQNNRRSMHWYKRRDITPSMCFDDCDAAALIVQALGKVPSICDPDSDFNNAYNRCSDCITTNGNATKETIRDYIEPEFVQFFNWCEAQESTPTTTADPEGPESQVTSAELTTETQESVVTPTFEPITTTSTETEGEEEEESTTSSDETEPSTTITTTTTSSTSTSEEVPDEEATTITSVEDEGEPEETASSAAGESPEETPEPTPAPTPSEESGEEDEPEESSTIYTAVTVTDEDGNISVTSSAIAVVPVPADEDATVTPPLPSPSSLPEEGEGEPEGEEDGGEEEQDNGPEVVPPPEDQPTPGEPGAETPTGPDIVGPTAAASGFSADSNSVILFTLASILAVFFA